MCKRYAPEDGTGVMVRNYGQDTSWIPTTEKKTCSLHSVIVQTKNGLAHHHPNQLCKTASQSTIPDFDDDDWPITSQQPNNNQIYNCPNSL